MTRSPGRIHVLQPGFQSTVQDLGRPGYGHLGISASGAADPLSLRIGNLLVGNPETAAAIEMTLTGGSFEFACDTVVGLAGSDFGVPLWKSFEVKAGQVLACGPARTGARCYLCVRGGIDVPPVLGSRSTQLMAGLGGAALKAGDVLPIGIPEAACQPPHFGPRLLHSTAPGRAIRVTAGPQSERFSGGFYQSAFLVSRHSNRMGLRLEGPCVEHRERGRLLTEGAALGAIQVPPDGQPIILFVEHQTTGGYPKIANVIAADLHLLGQLRPRDEVRFELVTMERARTLLARQEYYVRLSRNGTRKAHLS
ncbi:MAG: biotin-dependent carboxyltransferase [Bryobacterales bacterium]|nr:biotin-dependent carboxyltransferase [Bryobacterales bacterium]